MPQQQINILAIAPYRFLPVVNGGHKAIEQFYKNIGAFTKTIVVSTKSNDERLAVNYKLVKLFSDGFLHYLNPLYVSKLKLLIKEEQITHVITEHPYMGWLGIILKKQIGVKFIVRSHNIEAKRFKTLGKWWWRGMWQYEKRINSLADMNFFITEEDRDWAIKHYRLRKEKCTVITFGISETTVPSGDEKAKAKATIRSQYNIPLSHRMLLFNGDLSYEPNEEAVRMIITHIQPLLQQANYSCTILICGRNLSDDWINKIQNNKGNVIYTGYVEDIRSHILAADVFINSIVSGGGIKTKLVEALSYDCNTVSTQSGATGVSIDITNGKLTIVADSNWQAFASAVVQADINLHIGDDFYEYFYWGNIARKALVALENR